MVRSVRKQKKKRHHRLIAGGLLVLLAAAGWILLRFPLSLQEFPKIILFAAGKFSDKAVVEENHEAPVRGTIFDGTYQELSVSYRLYRLTVQPAELEDRQRTAALLSRIILEDQKDIVARFHDNARTVILGDDLDEEQAQAIDSLHLPGVSCEAVEHRFYPQHTMLAQVLGYTAHGVGLAGVEGRYDAVLQPGAFRPQDIPVIDFQGRDHLGKASTDLILTIRLDMQKTVERQLSRYLRKRGSQRGMALLLEMTTGRVRAIASRPAYNPNYFWEASSGMHRNRLYTDRLDPHLLDPILLRAAAIKRQGLSGSGVVPPTIAAPDRGFSPAELAVFKGQLGLDTPLSCPFSAGDNPQNSGENTGVSPDGSGLSAMQIGVAVASLMNGGWRITPWYVDGIYDHADRQRYGRRQNAILRHHVLEPAMGVKMRRELGKMLSGTSKRPGFAASAVRVIRKKGYTVYRMQELYLALLPVEHPRLELLLIGERDCLDPTDINPARADGLLADTGAHLVSSLATMHHQAVAATPPAHRNQEHYHQFLISQRLDLQPRDKTLLTGLETMPELTGLSLRKGLQRLRYASIGIRVRGAGRIVAQVPPAGASLKKIRECQLILAAGE